MTVGAGDNLDSLGFGVPDHPTQVFVQKRFAPSPQMQQQQVIADFVHEFLKTVEPNAAFRQLVLFVGDKTDRTSQIAGIGRFKLQQGWIGSHRFQFEEITHFREQPV
jgi:5'-3' exonuclease